MLFRILIGLVAVGGLEFGFCHLWLRFLEHTISDAGLIIYNSKLSVTDWETWMSAFGACLFWSILCMWARYLSQPKEMTIRLMAGLAAAVLVGMNLSALLKITTTAQFMIQDALADPEGKGRIVSVEVLSILGWNLGGAASATLFAAAILGVRRMLRDSDPV